MYKQYIDTSRLYNPTIDVKTKDVSVVVDVSVPGEKPHYIGTYEVTPKAHVEQTLETEDKVMDKDVTVKAIPYSLVSNPSNGKTATIA